MVVAGSGGRLEEVGDGGGKEESCGLPASYVTVGKEERREQIQRPRLKSPPT